MEDFKGYARIKVIAAKGIPLMGKMLKNAYKESYYGNIDDMAKGSNVGIRFSILNDRAINEAVNAKWSGKHFSKRLWDNTDKLAEESQKLVVKALMSGESLNKTADKLADKVQYVKYRNALGLKTMPSSFDKFQDLKYNDVERWRFIKLDYKRQNELKQNPELALPNANKATADKRKFTEYLFGGNNEKGLAKGRAFTSRLGYDINNYKGLQKEILKKADKYPAIKKETDIYGTKYEQKIILYGNKEKPANVIVGWKEHDGKTWLTSAYIKELK